MVGIELDEEAQLCLAAMKVGNQLPANVQQALQDPNWKKAVDAEYNSLVDHGVWKVTTVPTGRAVVGSRWNFEIKRGANGEILKYKARFVAKGFTQVYGRDYQDTYSPTVKLSSIRCLLACAAQTNCEVYQMDIKTAYLNADIDEEMYINQPEGFEKKGKNGERLACKLIKSLYGLKQSGRNWYLTLANFLKKLGFEASINDPCLFTKVIKKVYYYVCMWVDDIIYFSTDNRFYLQFKQQVEKEFTIGHLSPLHWFLGMKITCERGAISISQAQYIKDLL